MSVTNEWFEGQHSGYRDKVSIINGLSFKVESGR